MKIWQIRPSIFIYSSLSFWKLNKSSQNRKIGIQADDSNEILFHNFQVTVDSIDDKEDMQFADEAFDILGFTKEEKYDVFKVLELCSKTFDYICF